MLLFVRDALEKIRTFGKPFETVDTYAFCYLITKLSLSIKNRNSFLKQSAFDISVLKYTFSVTVMKRAITKDTLYL